MGTGSKTLLSTDGKVFRALACVCSDLHGPSYPIPLSSSFADVRMESKALRILAKYSASERTPVVDSKPLAAHSRHLRKDAHIPPLSGLSTVFCLWQGQVATGPF